MNTDHPESWLCISEEENEVHKVSPGFFKHVSCAHSSPVPPAIKFTFQAWQNWPMSTFSLINPPLLDRLFQPFLWFQHIEVTTLETPFPIPFSSPI
jgi:hypothetical protein